MDPVIFLEKVRRPALRGLVRERLERRTASLVGVGADSVSVTLVLGPPGSGKTTLLSHIAEAAGSAAWYRVGTEDDDEIALTRHLGHTLGAVLDQPALIEAAGAGRIAALVQALDDPAVGSCHLVIDDLHEIAGTPAERSLESFLSLRPRKIGITLGSRRPPRINTSRLLVSGELTQLDGEDLRFRSWEVEQLFREVYASPLSPEVAAALTRRTGGWAAGLQLFHLATAQLSREERERAVEELGGRSRLIRSYLARNVLDGLERDRRRFLLLTSTLGALTGDLCDELLGSTNSASVLAELEGEQFFTTSTDGGLTYHYHQVLQTHLEVLLVDELGGRAARDLYSRSATLLERAGRPAAAIRAHARAEDWGSVARLLKPDTTPVRGNEAMWGILSLPGAPTDEPGLVLAGARRLARHGQIVEAVAAYRQAEALLDDPQFRRRCTTERMSAGIWLAQAVTPALPAAYESGADTTMLRLSLELRRLTRQVPDPQTVDTPLVQLVALLLAGDVAGVARQLRLVEPLRGSATDDSAWEPLAVRLAARIVDLAVRPSQFAAGQVEEIVLNADVQGWPWISRIARGLQAAMLLAAGPTPWRITAAGELLDDLEQRGDSWTVCLTSLAIGAVYARIGEPALARRTLGRTEELATQLGAPVLGAWASVVRSAVGTPGSPESDRATTIAQRTASGLGLTHAWRVSAALPRTPAAPSEPVSPLSEPVSPLSEPVSPLSEPVEERGPAPSCPHVTLRCLGGFSLSVEGDELPWRDLRPRVRSLLMLLAMNHAHELHRERLVDALWPDATLSSGVRSLQVAVSSIRQCLGASGLPEDALRRHGDAYVLRLPGVSDQLADFERLARGASRAQGQQALRSRLDALDLYAGDLLPEVGPAEWVVEERARLRLLAASVGSEAAREALAAGELRLALEAATRSVALDPYHDSTWQLVVQTYDRLGDQSAAAVARRDQARVWADLGLVAGR